MDDRHIVLNFKEKEKVNKGQTNDLSCVGGRGGLYVIGNKGKQGEMSNVIYRLQLNISI